MTKLQMILVAAIALTAFAVVPAFAQTYNIQPITGGGYMITNPFDPGDTRYVQPSMGAGGGFVVTQPFNPGNTQYIQPNGGGGYTVSCPLCQN